MNQLETLHKKIDITSDRLQANLIEMNLQIKKRIYELTEACEDVNFNEISKLPINESYRLPSNICYNCEHNDDDDCENVIFGKVVEKNADYVKALVTFKQGTGIMKHFHADIDETIKVLEKDEILVFETNGEASAHILHKDDKYVVPAGNNHQVISMLGSTIEVTFRKAI